MKRFFLLLTGLSLFSIGFLAQTAEAAASRADLKNVKTLSDEWRSTYKFNKETYDLMQDNLEVVIDSHLLLHHADALKASLRTEIQEAQGKALQKIVNKGEKTIQYVLREYANNLREQNMDWSKEEREVRKALRRQLKARGDALEATIKSIGISAIPALSDFHARAMKHKAQLVTRRTKQLMTDIVKRVELDNEKARVRDMIGESLDESRPIESAPSEPAAENNEEAFEPRAEQSNPQGFSNQ